jgi:hypothetical protein
MKGTGMSGLGTAKYVPHVVFGTVVVAALVAATPSRFRVDVCHKLGTTIITISVKPLFVPSYLIIFRQIRKTKVSSFGEALVQWVLSLIETRVGAKHKHNKAGDGERPPGNIQGGEKRSSAGRSSQFRSGQRNKRHSSRKSGYQGFIDEARRIMVIEDLLVRGEIGFDDACTTALLCGALMAMGGILPPPQTGRRHLKVFVVPVYHQRCFALKSKLVVRVSLLNAARLVIFAKHMLGKG